jgi:hypothetical protein
VSPHVGAAGELVRHSENGYICALDEGAWVEAARRLLSDAVLWTEMSRQARRSTEVNTLGGAADRFMVALDELWLQRNRQERSA